MTGTAKTVYITCTAVLSMVLLGSCSRPPTTPITTAISPTFTASTTLTPDSTAIAEASSQAALDMGKTQNAAYFATSAAMKTARPPTATPTIRPSTKPAEGVSEKLVHDADTRTGLDEVDQIIDIVLGGDMDQFRQRIRFTTSGCTHEMALGGPPSCREGEAEGTMVEALPFLGPEGHFMRKDDVYEWQGIDIAGLYAVYRVSDEAYSSKDYPAGEYGIVFRTKDPQDIITYQVKNGSILRIDYTFIQRIVPGSGIPPELNFEKNAEEIILPPPNIKECQGAPPQRVMRGEQARVCTQSEDLIVREEPGNDSKPLTGIETGTNFMILDGPSCANHWSWWKVELDSGIDGWVAEGGDDVDPYFICPLE